MVDKKRLENVKYIKCVGSMMTNDTRCARYITSRIVIAEAAFNKKNTLANWT
jgi:hypothetical protein